ncbi:MAG TPA: hypothetical protein VFI15_02095 [Candidatus Limnocylindrales bacterium]|nr:hypothetical protein [Candidatus Limnocylindrales bacterium]
MAFLGPKLILTPLLIASASLAGRRWGALLSGWLIALPLTSGPIALFIALDLGWSAGADAATGALVGATAQVAFAGGYAIGSRRFGWQGALVTASAGYLVAAAVIAAFVPPYPPLLFLLALASIAVGLGLIRVRRPDQPLAVVQPGTWDIPARAIVATTLVLAISGLAPIIGGHVAGIVATYPVYISVLTSFAHRLAGPAQALGVVRGLLLGLPGFSTFFLVVSAALPTWPIPVAFGLALAAAIAINVSILVASTRRGGGNAAVAPTPES